MNPLKAMCSLRWVAVSFAFLAVTSISFAQEFAPRPKKHPLPMPPELLSSLQSKGKFMHPSQRAALALGAAGFATTNVPGIGQVSSVPLFNGSFSFGGATFPFVMVGHDPNSGRSASVENKIIPIILVFPDFVDQNGNPFVLDPTGILSNTTNSPIWERAAFPGGSAQFGDAIMRAEFPRAAQRFEWHDRLQNPRILNPVFVEVPGDDANLFFVPPNGSTFAVLDDEFWNSQLNTILELEKIDQDEFVILLTQDMFIAPNADPNNGFVLGFHDAFVTSQTQTTLAIQTFAWASWVSPTALQGQFTDILPLSHEVAEWFNDPFGINAVPSLQLPGAPSGACQSVLEVGDPLAGVPFPIVTDGTVYNPQVIALLQWFERKAPSDALDGDYSFPDPTVLTSPPASCPAQ